MKKKLIGRVLIFLCVVALTTGYTVPVAATTGLAEVSGHAGQKVNIEYTYAQIAGFNGVFTYSSPDIISDTKVTTSGLSLGDFKPSVEELSYFELSPNDFTISLELTISADAKVGDTCTVTLQYETTTDGIMPPIPVYNYDTVTIIVVEKLDASALLQVINEAEALKIGDYTSKSWEKLQSSLKNAKSVLTLATVQSNLDEAAKNLRDAISSLEKVPAPPKVDYAELNKQIKKAEDLTEKEYTSDSWSKLEKALTNAKSARSSDSQSTVDAATLELKTSINGLIPAKKIPALDYTEINKQIAKAEKLDSVQYTSKTWEVLTSALKNAKSVVKNAKTQAQINTASTELSDAIASLVEVQTLPTVDYTSLIKQIKIAEALYENDYTASSWAKVLDSLVTAKSAKSSNSQNAVDSAALDLKNAINGLVSANETEAANYGELNKQIAIAEALKASDFTGNTWATLISAVESAKQARNSNNQDVIDNAAWALANAIFSLKRADGLLDYTELDEQLTVAEGLHEKDYTATSWKVFSEVFDTAQSAKESKDQAEIDSAADKLETAVSQLVKLDYQQLLDVIRTVRKYVDNNELVQSDHQIFKLLTEAEKTLKSNDQAEIDACVEKLESQFVSLKENLEGRKDVETVIVEKEVLAEPTDDYCNIKSHPMWGILFWISFAVNLAVLALVVTYIYLKKRKTTDDTPLVDYDINDDAE